MKKLTTFLLALLLCCSVFVACTTDTTRPESTPIDSSSIATEDSSTPDSSIVEESALDSAVKYVRALYIMDSATTASDYYVIAQAPVGDQTFEIEWSVDVTEGVAVVTESDKEGMVLIDVTRGSTDVNYVLTATLTDGTDTKSVSFNRVVPFATVNTYAEYAASEKGNPLTVRGIVIGWEDKARGDSANSIYLQDLNNEGGYYLYSLSELPAGLAVGVTIEASGEFDNYNGTFELKNVSAKIIDSEAKTVAPVDYTEAFINAADTKAAELVSRQAMLVTLKGVTITDQNAEDGYLNFTLGGKTAYLRISGSHNCITKDEQAAMKALHLASYGSTADVTGYVAIYSGNFYLVPVDANAIANVTVPERNDAEKVELEKGALSVTSSVSSDTTLTLPVAGATYEEVAISWASDSEYAVVDGGNVAITVPDEKTTVTLTATLTLNDATDTASFEVVLNKMPTAIAELNALGAAQESYTTAKYIAEGVITKLIISGSYGNLYIKDNNGDELYVYGLYIDGDKYGDYTGSKPVEGDYVRVIGVVGQYKGTPQMKNADLMTFATPHNVASALTLTEGKAYVVATVKEVYNTSYGNMYLTDDGVNSFTIYGSYDVFGNRYDALAVKPEAGDIVGIYGDISIFKEAPQIKNGVIFYWAKGNVTPTCPGCGVENEEHAKCDVCGKYTCVGDHSACEAIAANAVILTSTKLGLGDPYKAGSATVDGVTFDFTELGDFGNGIQMRIKNENTASLGNATAFAKGIKEIRLVYNSAKSTHDNTGAFEFIFGNEAGAATYTTLMDTVSGQKEYVVTPDAETYTFFKMTLKLSYSFYWDSIIIVFAEDGGSDPAPSCPGCGEVGDAHAVCEVCGSYTCDGKDHTHAPAVTCPGCGVEGEAHAVCEVCGEYTCNGEDHTHAPAVTCPGCGVEGEAHAVCEVCGSYTCDGKDHTHPVENPFDGEYYLAMKQTTEDKIYYFTGALTANGYYLASSTEIANAAVVTVEAVQGGYYLTFTAGEAKNYLKIYASGTHTNVGFGTTAECLFDYNEKYNTFTAIVNGTEFFMGTYGTYNTFSASNISYAESGNYISYLVDVTENPAPVCEGCGKLTIHAACEHCQNLTCDGNSHDACAKCGNPLCTGDHSACAAEFSLTKVTSVDQLVNGATIVITYGTNVMGATAGSYFSRVSGFSANATELGSSWQTVTLVKNSDNTWTLKVGTQFIYTISSSNHAKLTSSEDNSTKWNITIASTGVATIQNVGVSNKYLQYNSNGGQERFSCYKNTQNNPTIYIVNG